MLSVVSIVILTRLAAIAMTLEQDLKDVDDMEHLDTVRPRCEYSFSVPIRDFNHVCGEDATLSQRMTDIAFKLENEIKEKQQLKRRLH
jgi:hypothetical protein